MYVDARVHRLSVDLAPLPRLTARQKIQSAHKLEIVSSAIRGEEEDGKHNAGNITKLRAQQPIVEIQISASSLQFSSA